MGILAGAMTVRRFAVEGEVPDGFRDLYRGRLEEFAFREPVEGAGKGEIEGWVLQHNLLEVDFAKQDRWLFEPYLIFALRVDKKTLPAKLLKATLEKECDLWCAQEGVERCTASKRKEIKEEIETKWLKRVLPNVRLVEVCWDLQERYLVAHTLSEGMLDRLRKRFAQTFGLKLVPWSPLDWLPDAESIERLVASPPTVFHGESS